MLEDGPLGDEGGPVGSVTGLLGGYSDFELGGGESSVEVK